MHLHHYESYPTPQVTPINAILHHFKQTVATSVGEDENRHNLASSALVENGIILLARGQKQKAKHLLKRAKQQMQIEAGINSISNLRSEMACTVIDLIWQRNNLPEVQRLHQLLHDLTIRVISQALTDVVPGVTDATDGVTGNAIGLIHEMTSIGLLNRRLESWQIAIPALGHHDRGPDTPGNYDSLFSLTSPYSRTWSVYKLQIKSGAYVEYHRYHYYEDIAVISAQESLGYNPTDEERLLVPSLLVAEWHGVISDNERSLLDAQGAKLISDIVDHRDCYGIKTKPNTVRRKL